MQLLQLYVLNSCSGQDLFLRALTGIKETFQGDSLSRHSGRQCWVCLLGMARKHHCQQHSR